MPVCGQHLESKSKKERSVKSLYREILATPRSRLSRVELLPVWRIQALGTVYGKMLCTQVTTINTIYREILSHAMGRSGRQVDRKTLWSYQYYPYR